MKNTILLKNESISIEVIPFGAELRSVRRVSDGQEYLWQRDPAYWPKTSPILFPAIGAFKDGGYTYKDQWYAMSKHGFARDFPFALVDQKEDALQFCLSSNAETKQVYPFDFDLFVTYRLVGSSLTVSYQVVNKGQERLFFCLGGHPAFNVPVEGYGLDFGTDGDVQRLSLEDGLLGEMVERIPLRDGVLDYVPGMFDRDALILQQLPTDRVRLLDVQGKALLTMSFDGFTHLGVWAPPGAPFVCIEPWVGVNDTQEAPLQLSQKPQLQGVDPNEVFERQWSVVFE